MKLVQNNKLNFHSKRAHTRVLYSSSSYNAHFPFVFVAKYFFYPHPGLPYPKDPRPREREREHQGRIFKHKNKEYQVFQKGSLLRYELQVVCCVCPQYLHRPIPDLKGKEGRWRQRSTWHEGTVINGHRPEIHPFPVTFEPHWERREWSRLIRCTLLLCSANCSRQSPSAVKTRSTSGADQSFISWGLSARHLPPNLSIAC